MIHNASSFYYGTGQELVDWGTNLIKLSEGSVLESYLDAMNIEREQIKSMLDAETWFTAQESFANGLATEIGNIVGDPPVIMNGRFKNTPNCLLTPAKAGTRNSAKNWDAKIRIAAKKYS